MENENLSNDQPQKPQSAMPPPPDLQTASAPTVPEPANEATPYANQLAQSPVTEQTLQPDPNSDSNPVNSDQFTPTPVMSAAPVALNNSLEQPAVASNITQPAQSQSYPGQPVYGPPAYAGVPANQSGGYSATAAPGESPDKEYLIALALSYFLGSLGIDRFYLGRTTSGVIKLLTAGGLGIWTLIDVGLIAFGKIKDKEGRPLQGFGHYNKTFKMVAGIVLVVQALVFIAAIFFFVITMIVAVTSTHNQTTYPPNSVTTYVQSRIS